MNRLVVENIKTESPDTDDNTNENIQGDSNTEGQNDYQRQK